MSLWAQHSILEKVLVVLENVPTSSARHQFGRPYISAYQLAIDFNRRYPDTVAALGKQVGGSGIGEHNSIAQYLANELSKNIGAAGDTYPVQGAFLSNRDATEIVFSGANGPVRSSLVGTDFDLSLFRLRPAN